MNKKLEIEILERKYDNLRRDFESLRLEFINTRKQYGELEMKIIEHSSMSVTDILKATLICDDAWYGTPWQECTKCPLYGKSNCEEILSQFQRIFIKEHIRKDEKK